MLPSGGAFIRNLDFLLVSMEMKHILTKKNRLYFRHVTPDMNGIFNLRLGYVKFMKLNSNKFKYSQPPWG